MKTRHEHCVVGSGPAGVACAQALLAQGVAVHCLDAAVTLDPERAALVERLSRGDPASWGAEQISCLKEGTSATTKGIPLKRVFGSDFPYRECDRFVSADFAGVGLRASLAQGGFSNVWGAAMMPYRDADLDGWPFKTAELAEHYAAVLKLTGLSARRDALEGLFPLYLEGTPPLLPSRQAQAFLRRLVRHQDRLARAGLHFGQARLAVRAPEAGRAGGCVYCGLCMYGCPYGYIYNSADTLRDLQVNPRFTYQPNVVVTRLSETADGVLVEGRDRLSDERVSVEAGRVFLATGVIPTTQILLRSRGSFEHTLWMKDSQYFLFPLALFGSSGEVRRESLHSLCQVFIEVLDREISPHTVHLQIYSYNDLVGQAVRAAFGPLAGPLGFLVRALEGRLLIVQGYLHSDHSSRISLALNRNGQGEDRLLLGTRPCPETRPQIARLMRKLMRHWPQLGAVPIAPMLQVAEPGRGFHSGGTFPMSALPGDFDSDLLGRPRGWHRVHAVDATVLPSIPATTITLSVMANAHRIGTLAASIP